MEMGMETDFQSTDWFFCAMCKQVFRQKTQLREHKRIVHLKGKSKSKAENTYSTFSTSVPIQISAKVQISTPVTISNTNVNTTTRDTTETNSNSDFQPLSTFSNPTLISTECQTDTETLLLVAQPIQFLTTAPNGHPEGERAPVIHTLSSFSPSSLVFSAQITQQQTQINPINVLPLLSKNNNDEQSDLESPSVHTPIYNQATDASASSTLVKHNTEEYLENETETKLGSLSITYQLATDVNEQDWQKGDPNEDDDENVGVTFESICVPENENDIKQERENDNDNELEMEMDLTGSGSDPKKPFKCSFLNCPRSFPNRHALKRHLLIHKDQRPFRCDIPECPMKFKRRDHVLAHIRRIHIPKPAKTTTNSNTNDNNSQQQQQSQPLNLSSSATASASISSSSSNVNLTSNLNSNLNLALNGSSTLRFKCKVPECEGSFATQNSLNAHMQTHKRRRWFRNPTPPLDQQQQQQQIQPEPEQQQMEVETKPIIISPPILNPNSEPSTAHSEEIDVKPDPENLNLTADHILPEDEPIINQIETIPEPLPITIKLPRTITTTTTTIHHNSNSTTSGGTVIVTPPTSSSSRSSTNSNSNSNTSSTSEISNNSTSGTVTGVRSFKECPFCEKILKTQKTLQRHLKLHRVSRFVCPHCRKTFTEKYYLTEHMRVHQNNPNFIQ